MKANRAYIQTDDAVSPVIGVILMVAITVVLAAVVFVLTTNLGDGGENAPSVSLHKKSASYLIVKVDSGLVWGDFAIVGCNELVSATGDPDLTDNNNVPDGGAELDPVAPGNQFVDCSTVAGLTIRHIPTNSLVYLDSDISSASSSSSSGGGGGGSAVTYTYLSDRITASGVSGTVAWSDVTVTMTGGTLTAFQALCMATAVDGTASESGVANGCDGASVDVATAPSPDDSAGNLNIDNAEWMDFCIADATASAPVAGIEITVTTAGLATSPDVFTGITIGPC